jgi:hypothetical protein
MTISGILEKNMRRWMMRMKHTPLNRITSEQDNNNDQEQEDDLDEDDQDNYE